MTSEPIMSQKKLDSGQLLARNSILNFFGLITPLLAAICAIPLFIKGLGTDRFGVLSLVWTTVGYFTLFDLGIGRALTQQISRKLGTGCDRDVPHIVWTSLILILIFSVIGSLVIVYLSSWLVYDVLKIPPNLQNETLHAFFLLSLSVPLITITSGLRGVLEAHQQFGLINAVRIPMGLFMFLGPLAIFPFSKSLVAVIAVLLIGRVIDCCVHLLLCFRIVPILRERIDIQREAIKPLFSLGGWMSISNVISPLMEYLDRYFIGTLLSISAVAYYNTPHELGVRLRIIPGSLIGVLFPAFAFSQVRNSERTALLFKRSVNYILLAMFPITLLMATFSHEAFDLWLGAEFAQNSAGVMQLLAFGIYVNSLAYIPYALIQSAGRPDITAKLHFAELPFYLVALWVLILAYGIKGAAIVWVARVSIDNLLLFIISRKYLPSGFTKMSDWVLRIIGTVPFFAMGCLISGRLIKVFFIIGTLMCFVLVGWFRILAPEDRLAIRKRLMIAN